MNNDLPLGSVCKLDARLVVSIVVVAVFVDVAAAEVRVSQLLPGGSVNI